MMKTLSRLMRHLTTTAAAGRRAFPTATLRTIEAAIRQGESVHRAEIKFVVEAALGPLDVVRKCSARTRAHELFREYQVWDTEDNCGILIYINLADRKVEIVADRGLDRVMQAGDWQAICAMMTKGFRRGDFHQSVTVALDALNRQLQQCFPDDGITGKHRNQLPDTPLML